MTHRAFRKSSFKPQLEILEDRYLLATQLMGTFSLGVEDSVFWDGPRASNPIVVPEIPTFTPSGACEALGEDHPCWDWKFDIAEPGRLRVALDSFSYEVRPWSDPRP